MQHVFVLFLLGLFYKANNTFKFGEETDNVSRVLQRIYLHRYVTYLHRTEDRTELYDSSLLHRQPKKCYVGSPIDHLKGVVFGVQHALY